MKKIICFMLMFSGLISAHAQLEASFEQDTLLVERDKNIDLTFHLGISINRLNTGGVPNTLTFTIKASPATTFPATDFVFTGAALVPAPGITGISTPITILHGQNPGSDPLFISIVMSYMNPGGQQKNFVLRIINKPKKETEKSGAEIGALSIGHSFDFLGKDNDIISYADIYVFSPNAFSIGKNPKGEKYGFALKLYQNKSITTDSLAADGSLYKFISQSLVNPFQPLVNDSVFIKQELMNRKTSYKSTAWGMYLRLFRDISYTNKKTKFYLGIHGEFLRRDIKTSYEYKTEKDTIIRVPANAIPAQNNIPLSRNTVQSEFYGAVFIQFMYNTPDLSAHFSLIPAGLNLVKNSASGNATTGKCFFLGQLDLMINKINVKVGAECRGLFSDRHQPYWNVFISKSFTWDKLKELIL